MADPTPEELLVINSLIYLFSENERPVEGQSLYDWAQGLAADEARLNALAAAGKADMTSAEVKALVATVTADDNRGVYDQMAVKDVTLRPGSPDAGPEGADDTNANMVIDYGGKPVFVFKGTAGDEDWMDNAMGGYVGVTDTPEQQSTMDYFNEWMQHFPPGSTAITSGHSKGGNEAQLVALLAGDLVDHAYSFDGQGFNWPFLLKYGDQISENARKITNISSGNDYVNVQFLSIPGSKQLYVPRPLINIWPQPLKHGWLWPLKWPLASLRRWHSPVTMLERDGDDLSLMDLDDMSDSPNAAIAGLDGLLAFLQGHMAAQDWAYLCHKAMSLFTFAPVSGDPLKDMAMPDDFVMRVLSLVKNYLEIQGLDPQDIAWAGTELIGQLFTWTRNPALMQVAALGAAELATLFALIPSTGYAGVPRDFRLEVKELLMNLADEVGDEPWWDVTKWDVWYRLDHSVFGGVDFAADESERAVYYRKMIDMNGTSRAEIERIFTEVYAAEDEFVATVQGWRDQAETVLSRLRDLSAGVPS
jgi:hypothetical protein